MAKPCEHCNNVRELTRLTCFSHDKITNYKKDNKDILYKYELINFGEDVVSPYLCDYCGSVSLQKKVVTTPKPRKNRYYKRANLLELLHLGNMDYYEEYEKEKFIQDKDEITFEMEFKGDPDALLKKAGYKFSKLKEPSKYEVELTYFKGGLSYKEKDMPRLTELYKQDYPQWIVEKI